MTGSTPMNRSSPLRVKKGAVPLGNCTYRARNCCAVASLPMAMTMTVPPPAVTVPPINLADDPGCRGKLGD